MSIIPASDGTKVSQSQPKNAGSSDSVDTSQNIQNNAFDKTKTNLRNEALEKYKNMTPEEKEEMEAAYQDAYEQFEIARNALEQEIEIPWLIDVLYSNGADSETIMSDIQEKYPNADQDKISEMLNNYVTGRINDSINLFNSLHDSKETMLEKLQKLYPSEDVEHLTQFIDDFFERQDKKSELEIIGEQLNDKIRPNKLNLDD